MQAQPVRSACTDAWRQSINTSLGSMLQESCGSYVARCCMPCKAAGRLHLQVFMCWGGCTHSLLVPVCLALAAGVVHGYITLRRVANTLLECREGMRATPCFCTSCIVWLRLLLDPIAQPLTRQMYLLHCPMHDLGAASGTLQEPHHISPYIHPWDHILLFLHTSSSAA